jgi:hypothetical protein
MNPFRFINVPVFLVSLAVGIFFVYMIVPRKREIFVYPTPESVDSIQYKDASGQCFSFEQTEISCPANKSLISTIPFQE